jgi:hypothetical protein
VGDLVLVMEMTQPCSQAIKQLAVAVHNEKTATCGGPDGHLRRGQCGLPCRAGLASRLPLGPLKILAIHGQ